MYFIASMFHVLMVGKVERPTVCSLWDGRLVRSIPNALIWNVLQSVFLTTGDLSKGFFFAKTKHCVVSLVKWFEVYKMHSVNRSHSKMWFTGILVDSSLDVFLLCTSSGCELISYFILTDYVLMYTQLLLLDKLCSKKISSSFEKRKFTKNAIYIVLSV